VDKELKKRNKIKPTIQELLNIINKYSIDNKKENNIK